MGCYSCMKYLFIFLNIIYLILGISAIVVIIWTLLDPSIPLHFTQEPDDFTIAATIYFIVSIMLILLSILGIYSVCKESKCALVLSFSLLLIIIVVQVASGVWIWVNKDTLDEFTHASVKRSVQVNYDTNPNIKQILDTIQSKMHCCGADNPMDWSRNKDINLGIISKPTEYNIPQSCCRENIAVTQCEMHTKSIKISEIPNYDYIYDKGCYIIIREKVINSLTIIFAVFGSVVGIKVLGLLIGLILAFSMNNSNRYKS